MTIRVHLADDHTMFREGLASILTPRAEDIEVVGQTSTGEEAIALIEENKPDLVIMQVEMQLKEVRACANRLATFRTWRLAKRFDRLFFIY